jgi:predicted transcriptional regulator
MIETWYSPSLDELDLTDEEIDARMLKALKRDPIPAVTLSNKVKLDPGTMRESLLRLHEEGLAEIEYGFGWKRKAPRPRMTKKEALAVVLDAAESWANELQEYIIPADEDSNDEDDISTTLNRKQQVDDIHQAIKLLSPKEET